MKNLGNKKALSKLAGIKGLSVATYRKERNCEQYGTDNTEKSSIRCK